MLRIQKENIIKDLKKKMVLLLGPRQSGKTYLAKDISKSFSNSLYLNYDQISDRQIIKDQSWLDKTDLLIFDELHKMPDWKNYIKGVYDSKQDYQSILVTGSARLDIFDKIGDSLAGRYFRHRLLPLSLSELKQAHEKDDMDHLLERGGFPEPFFEENLIDANRWRQQYVNSILSTDVFEFEKIHNLKGMRLVFDLLRTKIGSPISYQSLSEDVGVSSTTIKKYIQILESVYVIFIVTPYSKNIARSILKEPKIYFFDTALVNGDEGAKLENLVAISLLKDVYSRIDNKAEECSLNYLKTKDGKEIDFIITNPQEIEKGIEVKVSDTNLSKSLLMFKERYNIPCVQVVKNIKKECQQKGIDIVNVKNFLSNLYI